LNVLKLKPETCKNARTYHAGDDDGDAGTKIYFIRLCLHAGKGRAGQAFFSQGTKKPSPEVGEGFFYCHAARSEA
jgi:hypothetical protein